jgi:hypothetical protein
VSGGDLERLEKGDDLLAHAQHIGLELFPIPPDRGLLATTSNYTPPIYICVW